jgi:hypothetical protein
MLLKMVYDFLLIFDLPARPAGGPAQTRNAERSTPNTPNFSTL